MIGTVFKSAMLAALIAVAAAPAMAAEALAKPGKHKLTEAELAPITVPDFGNLTITPPSGPLDRPAGPLDPNPGPLGQQKKRLPVFKPVFPSQDPFGWD